MKYKNNLIYILLPIIQVIFFLFSYELINTLAHRMGWVSSRGVAWGITMKSYCFIYMLIVLISNILIYFLRERTLLIAVVGTMTFSIFVSPTMNGYPYRTSVVIVIGALGFLINYIAHRVIRGKRISESVPWKAIEYTPQETPTNIIYEPPTLPATGVIFLLANWSGPALTNFHYIKSLLQPYPGLSLYVYDIDKETAGKFMEKYGILSHGNGEVFWLYDGEIQAMILNYDNDKKYAGRYMKALSERP